MANRIGSFILLVLWVNFLNGEIDKKIEPSYVAVSLGFNCEVALMLQHLNMRCSAFPFDWNITPFFGLCDILENNFVSFLDEKLLVPAGSAALNTKYGIGFYHDFPTVRDVKGIDWLAPDYLNALEDIKPKYIRRITRFNDLATYSGTVYFFRSASKYTNLDTMPQTRQMVERLRDVITRKFPMLSFQLIVLGPDADYQHNWHMDGVQNFYLHDSGSKSEWEAIFKRLGLI